MSQVVVAGSVSKKGSDEEITEQIEDAGRESNQRVDGEEELKEDTSSVEQKQVEHRNEGEPYVIILAVGSTQDLPSVLGQVKEQFEKRQKELSKNVVIGPVLNPEEEKATKSVAEEISSTSDELQAELLRGCTTREERQEVAGAINEVTSALVTEFSGVTLDVELDVEALTTTLDIALTNLFQVPVAEQTPAQLVVTFVKMSLFAMVVINLCKKQWDEFSVWRFGSTVMIVGTALYKVADKHGLNAWVQNSAGGWCGLCSRVHDYIVQLTHRQTLDNSTTDGQENAVSIPWPSTNTVILFGSLTVFVGLYAYYKFR